MAQAMEKSKVIELLEYYKDIDGEVRIYRKIITDLTDQYYNPIGAIQCDGLPKGKNNISRQTENMALNIPDYVSGEIREYEEKVQQLQNLKAQMLQEISFKALPAALVEKVEVDVGDLKVGDTIRVADLPIAKDKDVDLMTDVDATVVTITEVHVKASDLEAEDTNADEAAEA